MLLKWTVIFFVIALIAGALGFSGIAAGAAKILFYLFLSIVILLIAGFIVAFLILGVLRVPDDML